MAENSERKHGRILPGSKHVYERLAHEEPNGDTDSHSYHRTSNVDPIARRGDRPSVGLRETRLGERKGQLPVQGHKRSTYRDQEEHSRDHNRESGPSKRARIDISQQAYRECANGRHDIRPVENEVVRGLVRHIGNTGDDHHHDDVKLTPGL